MPGVLQSLALLENVSSCLLCHVVVINCIYYFFQSSNVVFSPVIFARLLYDLTLPVLFPFVICYRCPPDRDSEFESAVGVQVFQVSHDLRAIAAVSCTMLLHVFQSRRRNSFYCYCLYIAYNCLNCFVTFFIGRRCIVIEFNLAFIIVLFSVRLLLNILFI